MTPGVREENILLPQRKPARLVCCTEYRGET